MWAVECLQKQVTNLKINANRHLSEYAKSGFDVFTDEKSGFLGPLSGMLTGLKQCKTEYVVFVPCDSPHLPLDLVTRLHCALKEGQSSIAYASDGERAHPTFALLKRDLIEPLECYLDSGERRLLQFMQQQHAVAVDFGDQMNAFMNINTLVELIELSGD